MVGSPVDEIVTRQTIAVTVRDGDGSVFRRVPGPVVREGLFRLVPQANGRQIASEVGKATRKVDREKRLLRNRDQTDISLLFHPTSFNMF
ncbi:MAG: hypothetical protein WCH39_28620, partial [Schlesneria sp.]